MLSYYESLIALNARLRAQGKAPVKLILVPDALEDEDMMEMFNAGLFERIIVDDWKAKMAQAARDAVYLRDEGIESISTGSDARVTTSVNAKTLDALAHGVCGSDLDRETNWVESSSYCRA